MGDWRQRIHHLVQLGLDQVFPPHCAGCQHNRGGQILCSSCATRIHEMSATLCLRCGSPLPAHTHGCQRCTTYPLHINGLRAAGLYEAPLRTCIHALKYGGNTRLADPLGALLVRAYQQSAFRADLIAAVPLHAERLRQRGYNQSLLLAQVCATQLRIPLQQDLLVRTRATPAQAQLPAHLRRQNVKDAFHYLPTSTCSVHGRAIALIDDVCTTGATLEACAAPLFAAGARSVWGLVLAHPSK